MPTVTITLGSLDFRKRELLVGLSVIRNNPGTRLALRPGCPETGLGDMNRDFPQTNLWEINESAKLVLAQRLGRKKE